MGKRKIAIEMPPKFPMTGSSVVWLEVESAEELRTQLRDKGVTKFARYVRNPMTYDGSVQGGFAGLDSLAEVDIMWVTEVTPTEVRHLLCAEK